MRILISNDDGENSFGLKVLIEFAKTIADEVYVIVPHEQRSAGGHAITIFKPLTLTEKSENFFVTNGTPADSVILALHHVLKDKKPDFMFSGVNIGHNLCDHIIYSGTVAAAREAALHGIPSIAFSQVYQKDMLSSCEENFQVAKEFIGAVFDEIKNQDFLNSFYGVNFPSEINSNKFENKKDLIKFVKLGKFSRHENALEMRMSPRNSKYFWINQSEKCEKGHDEIIDTDSKAIANGFISVTKLSLDLSSV